MDRKKIIISAILISFAIGCGTGINLFSRQDEVKMGAQFDEEIQSNPEKYPIYRDNPAVKDYIQEKIFGEILEGPEVKNKTVYNYELEIIDDDSTLNAFAVPGGYVYLYTGLIDYLGSEAALAGVLAHEIAHVERRHSSQRITNAYGLQILTSIALGNNPSQVSVIVANLFSGLTLLANSRSAEDEADKFAITYLEGSKFYPGSVKFFFERMKADGKVSAEGQSDIAVFLSTHPDPIDRISETEVRLRDKNIPVYHYNDYNAEGVYRASYLTNIKDKL